MSFGLGVLHYIGLIMWQEGWKEKFMWELVEKHITVPVPKQKKCSFLVTPMTTFLVYSLPLLYEQHPWTVFPTVLCNSCLFHNIFCIALLKYFVNQVKVRNSLSKM